MRAWVHRFITTSPAMHNANWRTQNAALARSFEVFVAKKDGWAKAQGAFAKSDFKTAVGALRMISNIDPNDHCAKLNLATALASSGDHPGALATLDAIVDTWADDASSSARQRATWRSSGRTTPSARSPTRWRRTVAQAALETLKALGVLAAIYEDPKDAASLIYVRSDKVGEHMEAVWAAAPRDAAYYLQQATYHQLERRPAVALATEGDRSRRGGLQGDEATTAHIGIRIYRRLDEATAKAPGGRAPSAAAHRHRELPHAPPANIPRTRRPRRSSTGRSPPTRGTSWPSTCGGGRERGTTCSCCWKGVARWRAAPGPHEQRRRGEMVARAWIPCRGLQGEGDGDLQKTDRPSRAGRRLIWGRWWEARPPRQGDAGHRRLRSWATPASDLESSRSTRGVQGGGAQDGSAGGLHRHQSRRVAPRRRPQARQARGAGGRRGLSVLGAVLLRSTSTPRAGPRPAGDRLQPLLDLRKVELAAERHPLPARGDPRGARAARGAAVRAPGLRARVPAQPGSALCRTALGAQDRRPGRQHRADGEERRGRTAAGSYLKRAGLAALAALGAHIVGDQESLAFPCATTRHAPRSPSRPRITARLRARRALQRRPARSSSRGSPSGEPCPGVQGAALGGSKVVSGRRLPLRRNARCSPLRRACSSSARATARRMPCALSRDNLAFARGDGFAAMPILVALNDRGGWYTRP